MPRGAGSVIGDKGAEHLKQESHRPLGLDVIPLA